MSDAPGPLLARGWDADVFAIGDRRVLRRYRRRPVPEREVAIMRYIRKRGYPAPEVHDVDGPDLILERVDGPTMAADLVRRPWRAGAHARTLARLHRELHAIEPPGFLGRSGPAVLHLDLHPLNVILSRSGPIVIDWANAMPGEAALDVALTAVVMSTAPIRPPLAWIRRPFVRAFLNAFTDPEWRPAFDEAVAFRCADSNVSEQEKGRARELRL